jgi:hypothetical protein
MRTPLRRAKRVLQLVHEFHKRGCQLLRIEPEMAASGCLWRCTLTPRRNVLRSHGALIAHTDRLTARYRTAQENRFFGWRDAKQDTVKQLADRFARRFPEIVDASQGDDWSYAGWYVRMLGYAELGQLPIAYADWDLDAEPHLPLLNGGSDLPMPPPSDARTAGVCEK